MEFNVGFAFMDKANNDCFYFYHISCSKKLCPPPPSSSLVRSPKIIINITSWSSILINHKKLSVFLLIAGGAILTSFSTVQDVKRKFWWGVTLGHSRRQRWHFSVLKTWSCFYQNPSAAKQRSLQHNFVWLELKPEGSDYGALQLSAIVMIVSCQVMDIFSQFITIFYFNCTNSLSHNVQCSW